MTISTTTYVKWVAIEGFPDYKVSNNGLVKKDGLLITVRLRRNNGHPYVIVFNKSAKKIIRHRLDMHKLVFLSFSGMELKKGYHIHHKDFNFLNNHIDNLEYKVKADHYAIHGKKLNPKYY